MIYLLHGNDIVSSRKKLEEVKSKYDSTGISVLSAKDLDYSQFPLLFSTVSMFDEKRLVIVEDKLDSKLFDLNSIVKSDVDLVIWIGSVLRSNDALIGAVNKVKGKVELFEEKPDLSVFPFLDSVASRRRVVALREYLKLKQEGNDPIYLVTMLVWQFRQIIVPEMASGFVKKKVEGFKANFTFEELRRIYYLLLQMDVQLKTGEGVPDVMVEQFIFKVTK
jgi:DNA polymerase III delta subunit